jgi:hypothetical protein
VSNPSNSPAQQQTSSNVPASIQLLASARTDHQLDVTAKALTATGTFVANVVVTFSTDSGTIAPANRNC